MKTITALPVPDDVGVRLFATLATGGPDDGGPALRLTLGEEGLGMWVVTNVTGGWDPRTGEDHYRINLEEAVHP